MIPLRTLLYFYRRRLRVHAMQELLAGFGIAAGVALVFSVQIANSSMTGSAKEILRGITGNATLQLAARDPNGFDQSVLSRVREIDGVAHASAVLEQRATVSYAGRRVPIDFVGVDPSLPSLGGVAARYFQLGGLVLQRGVLLPSAIGDALRLPGPGAGSRPPFVTLGVRGHTQRTPVTAVLDAGTIGSLAGGLVGVVSLRYAQQLTGLDDRVSRVLVVPTPGAEAAVRRGLTEIATGRLTVAPVAQESRLLEQAAGPIDQATGLFAGISFFVGFLFACTAMLLTVPERRRFIAELRIMGYQPRRVVQILGFQALLLGVLASLVGLLAGWVLSRTATHDPPGYLAFAFPLGIQRVVSIETVLLPFLGGVFGDMPRDGAATLRLAAEQGGERRPEGERRARPRNQSARSVVAAARSARPGCHCDRGRRTCARVDDPRRRGDRRRSCHGDPGDLRRAAPPRRHPGSAVAPEFARVRDPIG